MRILNVTAQKPDSTGSGTYLAQTVRAQVAAGHETAVVCGVDVTDDPAASLPDATVLHAVRFNTPELAFDVCGMSDEMPYAATRYRDLTPDMTAAFEHAFRRVLRDALADFRPDLVICHHLYLVTALTRELVDAARPDAARPPVWAVCHSTDLRQMATHGLERDYIIGQIRTLDGIFALHAAQVRQIADAYGVPPEKIRVVGAGYDANVFHRGEPSYAGTAEPAASPESAAPPEPPLEILYVGKIWQKKGVGCLLDAYDLCDFGPRGARLRLVGGHNDEDEYGRLASRAGKCRMPVELVGPLSPEELAVRYRAADVFVLPSFFEGLPLVVVEALACGCRVVVSDLPGIREWLEAAVPDAPVVHVRPPRMRAIDEPCPEELPAFSERVAAALEEAAALPPCTCDMSALSWEGLTRRMVGMLGESRDA